MALVIISTSGKHICFSWIKPINLLCTSPLKDIRMLQIFLRCDNEVEMLVQQHDTKVLYNGC